MSYQPRHAAAFAEPAELAEPTPDAPQTAGPRYAAQRGRSRVFAKVPVTLGMVTAALTAGVLLVGSSGDSAVALNAPQPTVTTAVTTAAAAVAPLTLVADLVEPVNAKSDAGEIQPDGALYDPVADRSSKAEREREGAGDARAGAQVSATSTTKGDYREIAYEDGFAWVAESGLSESAPIEASGTTWDTCSRGSSIEGKLRKDTVHIYRSVCALFPDVNSYGGWRAGGLPFHRNGRAVDIMLTPRAESALGKKISRYLIAHAKDFNIDHIIFEQHIWTPSTPRWRKMGDRGGITANHYDHVHVAIKA